MVVRPLGAPGVSATIASAATAGAGMSGGQGPTADVPPLPAASPLKGVGIGGMPGGSTAVATATPSRRQRAAADAARRPHTSLRHMLHQLGLDKCHEASDIGYPHTMRLLYKALFKASRQ
jgi:hypothetical protein